MYFYHPEIGRQLDSKLEIHKDQTLADAVEMAWKVGQHCRDGSKSFPAYCNNNNNNNNHLFNCRAQYYI